MAEQRFKPDARRARRWLGPILGVVAVVGTGCGSEPIAVAEFEQEVGVPPPVQPEPPAREPERFGPPPGIPGVPPGIPGAPAPEQSGREPAVSIGFDDGATVATEALDAVPGEGSLIQVVLYDGYGIAITVSAAGGDLDRVVIRGSRGEAPQAVPDAMVRDPEAARFGAGDLDWSIIPSLVERTPGELALDGTAVSHVIVEKNIPFSPDLVIRVYGSGPRRGGRIDYFTDGRTMRAYKD